MLRASQNDQDPDLMIHKEFLSKNQRYVTRFDAGI
jgi:hypothetical protein